MNNERISVLVPDQVPEFVREEYPKFVSFLKAYYEFLEKSADTNNDLVNVSKQIREISDVDSSLDEFEQNFYNKFTSLLPRDTAVRKDILYKNISQLYRSKGSIESYKFLFRMLFGEEVDVIEPKNEILKASASVWSVENSLRIDPDIFYQKITGNGTKKTFILPSNAFNVKTVLINDVVTTSYLVNKQYKKIIFNTAPSNGSIVKIYFDTFDFDLLKNRKIIGSTSGATGIIESTAIGLISNRSIEDLFINSKNVIGNFENGEFCTSDIIDENGNVLLFEFLTSSSLKEITIVNPGSNYTPGQFLNISGGNADKEAVAIIEEVFSGRIDTITVDKPGAGFISGGLIETINPRFLVNGSIQTIDTTSINVTSSYLVYSNTKIANVSSVTINAGNYNVPSKSGSAVTKDSRIFEIFTNLRTFEVGGIKTCLVLPTSSGQVIDFAPTLDAKPLTYSTAGTAQDISRFNSLGGYRIVSAGSGYKAGDEIVFGNNPVETYGIGAAARVSLTGENGEILKIAFEPIRVQGTVNVSALNANVTGTGTVFNTDLIVGDQITVNGQIRTVQTIVSDTLLTCDSNFLYTSGPASSPTGNQTTPRLGVYNRYPTGGILYKQNNFPTITVQSTSGVGGQIVLDAVMGDGEILSGTSTKEPGGITRVKIIDGGRGYKYIPFINMTTTGDGQASLTAEIDRSFETFEGKWTTSDSIISSTERKIQGRDYYVDYSYVLSSKVEFRQYKRILKELLHPAGLVNYSRFKIDATSNVSHLSIIKVDASKTLSGRVNVQSGKVYVTGYGTNFEAAYQKGYIKLGDAVDINGKIYILDQIVSASNIKLEPIVTNSLYNVSAVPFDYSANLQPIIVIGKLMANLNTHFVATGSATITMEDLNNLSIETDSTNVLTTD
jgi:hypothetical protein